MTIDRITQFFQLIASSASLVDLIDDWSDGYSKDDAHGVSASRLRLEKQILEQAPVSSNSKTLWRGTAVSDKQFQTFKAKGQLNFKLKPVGLLTSWTTDRSAAESFFDDAVSDNMCSFLLKFPASAFSNVIDVDAITHKGEAEFLVPNQTVRLTRANVVKVWEYVDD